MTTMSNSTPSTRKQPRRRWPLVLAGLLLLGGVGGGVYLVKQRAQDATPVQTTSTTTAQQGTVRVSVSGPGTLNAPNSVTVSTTQGGTVGTLPNVGDQVTKGQLITTLINDNVTTNLQNAQLALSKAQATLASTISGNTSSEASRQSTLSQAQQTLADAQRALSSQQQLMTIGASSKNDLNTAQSAFNKAQVALTSAQAQQTSGQSNDQQSVQNAQIAVQQAQVSLTSAQKAQSELKVYAPMSGVISTVSVTSGTNLNLNASGAALVGILDDSTLYLPVQIDETEVNNVKVGQEADVTLDAVDGQTFQGQVINVSPSGTQSNGIAVFTATVKLSNPDHLLKSGMTAEAEIIQKQQSGLMVPSKAIESVRTRNYVQVPAAAGNSDGLAVGQPQRVRVEIGATDGTNTIVTDGLKAGQEVITLGSTKSSTGNSRSGNNSTRSGSGFGSPAGGGFGGPP